MKGSSSMCIILDIFWNMSYDKYVILCVSSLSYCMHMGINCGHFLNFYIQIWDTENVQWQKMIITYIHATQKVNYNDIPKIPVDSFICVNTGGEGTRHQGTRLLGNAFGAPKKQLFSSPNFGDGFLGQQTSRSRPRRAPPQENKKCPDEGGKSKGQDKWQEEAVFYFFHLGCGFSTRIAGGMDASWLVFSIVFSYSWILSWLVVLTILKNTSQWEGWHPIYEMENKNHVPNHQPTNQILFVTSNFLRIQEAKYLSIPGLKAPKPTKVGSGTMNKCVYHWRLLQTRGIIRSRSICMYIYIAIMNHHESSLIINKHH